MCKVASGVNQYILNCHVPVSALGSFILGRGAYYYHKCPVLACQLTVLGAVCVSSLMVASSCSSVDSVSGRYRARDSSSSEVGMRSSRCSVSHCFNWSRSRCSDTPSARIPRARLADCSSAMDRFSTPSFRIICSER